MSRSKKEFIHRTTIFEGAFRAWSLIGTLDPDDPNHINPALSTPDPFELKSFSKTQFAYEPLPRSGLQHPYVKAILSPWLGPNVNQDSVELGLATLRTWWQHRRKGSNKTATVALEDIENTKVMESYLKHFFTLAHCLVFRDKVQAPRSLQIKLKSVAGYEEPGGTPAITVKGQCIPGAVDLEGMVEKVNRFNSTNAVALDGASRFGDPNTAPMVFINRLGDKHMVLEVGGITCAHCVKIVETVLRGCQGSQSPINGLIDAAADRCGCVLVKIDNVQESKRIAYEAKRNLALVGYTTNAREIPTEPFSGDLDKMEKTVANFAQLYPTDLFDWEVPCDCPDSGVYRDKCQRHHQINEGLFRALDSFQSKVLSYARDGDQPPPPQENWNPSDEDDLFGPEMIEPIPLVPRPQSVPSTDRELLMEPIQDDWATASFYSAGPSQFHSHFAPLDLDADISPMEFDNCEECRRPTQI